MSYDMIDRFLRNNLEDDDYAEYSAVLDSLCAPQLKPLTNKEIMAIGKELGLKCRLGGNPNIDFDYARAIEAKLKAKNE